MVCMCKTKIKAVSFVEGCGVRGWFQIRNNDSNRASNEDTVATKGQREKLIPEVKVFWLNKYLGCSLSVQEPGRLLFMS